MLCIELFPDGAAFQLTEADCQHRQQAHCQQDIFRSGQAQGQQAAVEQDAPVGGGEHRAHLLEGQGHISVAVEHPDHAHQQDRPHHLEHIVPGLAPEVEFIVEFVVQRLQLLRDHNDHPVGKAPDNEIPGRAMPDARGQPHHEAAQVHRHPFANGGAQVVPGPFGQLQHGLADVHGVENIIREPGAHGDMPAVPVFLDIPGEVGQIEVFRQPDTHALGDADGDIDAAGEVAVELESIEQHGNEHISAVVIHEDFAQLCGHLLAVDQGQNGYHQPVGDDHLLEIAPQNPHEALGYIPALKAVGFVQGLGQVAVAADGALDHLGEEGDEEGQLEDVILGLLLATVYIDDVAHGLEGVEGDAHGHDHVHQSQLTFAGEEIINIGNDEIGILRHGQDAQIQNQAPQQDVPAQGLHFGFVGLLLLLIQLPLVSGQVGLLLCIHLPQQSAGGIGGHGGDTHEQQVHRAGAPVEKQAGDQQQGPLPFFRQQIVKHQRHRHEGDEFKGCEQHQSSSSSSPSRVTRS